MIMDNKERQHCELCVREEKETGRLLAWDNHDGVAGRSYFYYLPAGDTDESILYWRETSPGYGWPAHFIGEIETPISKQTEEQKSRFDGLTDQKEVFFCEECYETYGTKGERLVLKRDDTYFNLSNWRRLKR